MANNPEDLDLPVHEAILREMRTCSVDSGSDFHLLRCIKRMQIQVGHSDLIREIEQRLPFAKMGHHRELALETIESLRRKKAEVIRDDERFKRSILNIWP